MKTKRNLKIFLYIEIVVLFFFILASAYIDEDLALNYPTVPDVKTKRIYSTTYKSGLRYADKNIIIKRKIAKKGIIYTSFITVLTLLVSVLALKLVKMRD